jgi:uncharacterized protein YdaU (DUF1376 family)
MQTQSLSPSKDKENSSVETPDPKDEELLKKLSGLTKEEKEKILKIHRAFRQAKAFGIMGVRIPKENKPKK